MNVINFQEELKQIYQEIHNKKIIKPIIEKETCIICKLTFARTNIYKHYNSKKHKRNIIINKLIFNAY